MANRSRFENGIMESIWSEISESGIIDETIKDNGDEINEAVKEYIGELDVCEFIDVDDEIESAIEKTIKDKVNVESILNIISETPEFKKLIQDKVLEEFNKLWIA